MSDVETDLYITIADAAAELETTQENLREAIRTGRLAGEKMFRQWHILRTDFEAYRERVRPNGERIKGRPKGAKDKRKRKLRGDTPDANPT